MPYEKEIYDDRGQLLSAVEIVGAEREILRSWSKSGVLILEAHTSNGEYNGGYRSWWDNGVLKEEGTFASGKRIGIYRWYLESGVLWQEVDCDDAL